MRATEYKGAGAHLPTMPNQEPVVEDIQDFAQNIVDTVREPLVMLLKARKLGDRNHGEVLVVAIADVTELRRAEAVVKAIGTYAQDIVDTVREPLLMLDTTLRVKSANRAFYQTFHVSPEET